MVQRKRLNKRQRKEEQKKKVDQLKRGDGGVYLYQNNTSGDLFLPKPMPNGGTRLPKGGYFQGDSYFKQFIPRDLRLVRTIIEPPTDNQDELMGESLSLSQTELMRQSLALAEAAKTEKEILNESIQEENEMEKKLILDQPDIYTEQGQVEHVLPNKKPTPINEQGCKENKKPKKDVLLTEDPLDGVEIILG